MNKVVHFEIPVDDWERAKKFYADNFGWNMMDMKAPSGEMLYMMAQAAETDKNNMVQDKGAINGGLFKRTAQDSVPKVYIAVDSIEEVMKKIELSGGKKITDPQPIPGGRAANFQDSEGNVIGVVDSKQ